MPSCPKTAAFCLLWAHSRVFSKVASDPCSSYAHVFCIPAPPRPSIADSAYLLECLIGAAPRLIIPYVSPIQKALVARLKTALAGSGSGAAAVMLGGPRGAQISHVGSVMAAGVSVQRKRGGRGRPPVQQR